MFFDSNHVLKAYFKPSRKNKDFVFLPVPILPGWLKILHLKLFYEDAHKVGLGGKILLKPWIWEYFQFLQKKIGIVLKLWVKI